MTLARYATRFEPAVPVDELTPHPKNPNKSDVGTLSRYMEELGGFYGAVLVQESTGYILAGEHRWRAVRSRSEPTIPVLYQNVDDLTAKRIVALDNRSAELGKRDEVELAELLESIQLEADSLEGTGYDEGFLDAELDRLAGELVGDDDGGEPPARLQAGAGFTTESVPSNEWYTPADLLEAARSVYGRFDLDPASCEEANELVQAETFYTKDDDGLAQPWAGVVWLNPPYGLDEDNVSNQAKWSERLRRDFEAGELEGAFLLVTFVPDRSWFEPLWRYPMAIPRGRIKYRRPGGEEGGQPIGSSAVIYFGDELEKFRDAFGELGRILIPEDEKTTRVQ